VARTVRGKVSPVLLVGSCPCINQTSIGAPRAAAQTTPVRAGPRSASGAETAPAHRA